jgi:chromate transporter
MIIPSAVLAYFVSGWFERHNASLVVKAIRRGLAPATVGLLACAAYVFIREVDVNVGRAVLTIMTVVIAYRTKFNPIWLVAAGAALGLAGLVN